MIKLVVIDLDGTTLQNQFTLHPYNIEVIKEYHSKGIEFVIATGRPFRSSRKFYKELGLTTPIINYNGAYIHHPLDSSFKQIIKTIKKEDVITIENDLKSYLQNIMCEYEDEIFIHEEDEVIDDFFWKSDSPIHYGLMKDNLNIDPCTFIIELKDVNDSETVLKYMEKFPDYSLRFWGGRYSRFGEIIPKGISKASGIYEVLKYLNIAKNEVLVIGDAGNDVPMLEEFEESCCLINGEIEPKKVSKYITSLANSDGGVGHFLKSYFEFKGIR